MLKKILHTALLLCLALAAQAQNPYLPGNLQGGPPAPGPRTRTPLNALERATNNLEGVTTLTDTFGNLRLALYVHVEDTCINYRPAATGNTQNLSAFVKKCSTDSIWYIDFSGRSMFLGEALTIQQIVDSIASDTSLQYNWYTRDATTTDALRTATILGSAQWLGDAPDGSIYFEMGSLGGGRALIDTAAAVYHSGLGGLNIVQTDAQGIDITTSNTASRAVNLTTDTLNMVSSFDPALMRVNLLSDGTYFFADSLKTWAIGQFAGFPNFNEDATERGILNTGSSIYVTYGNGITGSYSYLLLDEFQADLWSYTNDVSFSGLSKIEVSPSGVSGIKLSADSYSSENESGRAQIRAFEGEGSTSFYSFGGSLFPNQEPYLKTYKSENGEAGEGMYASMEKSYSNNPIVGVPGAFVYLGYLIGTPADGSGFYSENIAFGVQQRSNADPYPYYDWLKIDLSDFDTTANKIVFYNGSYSFVNDRPSPTLGDTSFHYWAGNGTTTNPGFITLAQVQAGVPNWYNSNGTTTDNTRIATVTETATWLSADAVVDGVFPFRFELDGSPVNEPEMMVWKFPTDSLTLAQSDQEIFFRSTNRFLLWADNDFVVTADSISLNGTVIGANGAIKNGIVYTPFSNEIAQSGLGVFTGLAAAQSSSTVEFRQITGTAQSELFVNGSSERMILPFAGTAWNFSIRITAVCDVVGNGVGISAGETWTSWHLGGIKRVGSSTSLVGSVQTPATAQSDTGMSTSVVTIDADDTNESLRIQFTPPSTAGSTTVIRVVATVELTEIGF